MVWIVWNLNNLRLMEERFALGLRFEAVSLRRWRFEARGKEIRGFQPFLPPTSDLKPPKALPYALAFRLPSGT
jgi:hypothetical protein